MPIQPFNGPTFPAPLFGTAMGGSGTLSPHLMDAAGEKVAFVCRAPKAGTLARAHFRTENVVVGDDLKVSFQTVDPTTGSPDGVVDQFRTQVVANGDDDVWFRTGLMTSDGTDGGVKRTVAMGELVAVVIEFNAYVAGNLNIAALSSSVARGPFIGTTYVTHFTAAWAKNGNNIPLFALEYDDGSFAYLPLALPIATLGTLTIATNSSPDEAGLLITLPFKARVWGAWVSASIAGDADVLLYDTNGETVLGSASLDKDVNPNAGNTGAHAVQFATGPTLPRGVYRLVLKPSSTTPGTLRYFDVSPTPGAALLDQMDAGQGTHWTQRVDNGPWSEIATRRALMGLILSGLDDGTIPAPVYLVLQSEAGADVTPKIHWLKYGDTLPILQKVLLNPDGTPYDLTGATALKLHIRLTDDTLVTRDLVAEGPLTAGVVRYAWVAADWDPLNVDGFLIVGPSLPPVKGTFEHRMEYEVIKGAARLTFPNNGHDILRVWDDLGQG